jgi:DNA-binding NarL/FixJ family response regulator
MPGSDSVSVGPMQLIAVGFDSAAEIEVRILQEVDRLQGRGVLRLLDVLVVTKNDDGSVTRLFLEDKELGDLLGGVLTPDAEGLFGLFDGDDVTEFRKARSRALAERLAPGALLVILLVEHRWARPLFDAVVEAGGVFLGDGFMTEQAQDLVRAEVEAFEEAAQGIAVAQAVEADAARQSLAAVSAAEDTVAAAAAVRAAAAADAVNALIEAGLIERAAEQEAVDVIAAVRQEIDASQDEVTEAKTAASVTPAEIRVLRYLATGMTFAVIADKLGISRSAAKERAERAYKKLHVHNRADAVVRAGELGLIPRTT